MDFRFTDDQLTLAEGVRDFLAGTHGPDVLRRLDAAAGQAVAHAIPRSGKCSSTWACPRSSFPKLRAGWGSDWSRPR